MNIYFYIIFNIIIIVSSSSRILTYYYKSSEIYTIEENKDNYKAFIKNHNCSLAPCNQNIINEKTIKNKEDIDNLKIVFDEIFNGTDTQNKEKIVNYEELTPKQNEIIINVLERNKILYNFVYTINDELSQYNKEYEKRGYYYEEENDEAIITVAMGKKFSGGYSIKVEKIEFYYSFATIYVNETEAQGAVTLAITYPVVQIKIKQIPSKVTVLNTETGEKFDLLEEEFKKISGSVLNVCHILLFLLIFIF